MLNKSQVLASIIFTCMRKYDYITVKYIMSKLVKVIYKLYSYTKYD
jgi:hypothetical protein